MANEAAFLIPGDPEQLTGGYIYDRHMVSGLRRHGWAVLVNGLPGRFPDVDDIARDSADACLQSLPDGHMVIIDGLALGGLPEVVARHVGRLRLVAMIHHPLADETGLEPERRQALETSEREALRYMHHVLVTSTFTASRMRDYGVPADRISVVVPGTDPAPPAPGSTDGWLRLLCVGSVIPRKGYDVLIRALARLPDTDWTCQCVGSLRRDRTYAGSVMEMARELDPDTRISFVGERPPDALAALWRRADVFVLASHYEGYGMVITEALARGLPVIATRGGALSETIPENAGLLSEPGDIYGLATNLRRFMSEPQLRVRMRAGALQARRTLQDWPAAADGFVKVLKSIQGGTP